MKCRIKNKSKTIFIIIIDNEIRGILSEKILRFFSLEIGKETEITKEEFHKLNKEIENFAREKLLNYLSYRERSLGECRNYLKNLPLHPDSVKKLLKEAIENNYINDARFAEMLVLSLLEKGKSKNEIKNKLFEKRIDEQIIDKTLAKLYSAQKNDEILEKNVKKAWTKFSRFPKNQRIEKCLNYLARRGFSYSETKEKINKIKTSED
ncbi:MAG: hypothetical protein DRZ79_06365 [Candidatus Cloacimonadota bacterium]|nr:MAG: hypothetical protein DRZ79_06365 [Candidatus Cloacimonadota bacterium]